MKALSLTQSHTRLNVGISYSDWRVWTHMYDWLIADQTILHVDDQASNTHEIASDQRRCI